MSSRPTLIFEIPPGAKEQVCRGCGAPVFWTTTEKHQWMPLNPDGVSHFATCPKAKEFRRER